VTSETQIDKIADCPVMTTVEAIGGRWKPRILWHLRGGPARFGELHRALGASERMLARSLKDLEAAGIVTRRVVPAGGVNTTEYAYSAYGRSLVPVLDSMGQWGLDHRERRAGGA
jgi:DNA-binding HxlR family transcriptional regulator